jgi:hypothetical protein
MYSFTLHEMYISDDQSGDKDVEIELVQGHEILSERQPPVFLVDPTCRHHFKWFVRATS